MKEFIWWFHKEYCVYLSHLKAKKMNMVLWRHGPLYNLFTNFVWEKTTNQCTCPSFLDKLKVNSHGFLMLLCIMVSRTVLAWSRTTFKILASVAEKDFHCQYSHRAGSFQGRHCSDGHPADYGPYCFLWGRTWKWFVFVDYLDLDYSLPEGNWVLFCFWWYYVCLDFEQDAKFARSWRHSNRTQV